MQSDNVYFPEFYVQNSSAGSRSNNDGNFNQLSKLGNIATISHNSAQDEHPIRDLRSIEEIQEHYRSVFANFSFFNVIQSRILDDVLYSDESIVVSAPTGSGKTVIFELAILRLLMNLQNSCQVVPYKIVYVAPMKALCEERLVDWHCKFANFGITCISVTGDSENWDFQSLLDHNLIITTPEKWDSLTRRWRENRKLVALIKLFMIDEVHLLSEDNRGPTLEAIVGRMKTMQDLLTVANDDDDIFSKKIRFVAVSATIPNAEDIAEWLSMPTAQAKSFKFGDDMRPVNLKRVVLGYHYNPQTSTPFKFDIMLNYKLESIMVQYAEGKPTLIFCSTRKNVEMTSRHITQNITINLPPQQRQILLSATLAIRDSKIREMLVRGVSYHHAGLSIEDRKVIENLFRNANLPILVTTSTLAMGVNLPAHLVIIKSTKYYSNGEYRDYSECMLLQMIGRAGRPQFDTSATAVILTTATDKQKYENMVGGEQPVESNLHRHLAEHLNAEVVLQTITDLGVAMQWLTSTFLYIRARKHPRHYGLPLGLSSDQIDKKLLGMCQIEINKLARGGMLTIDQNNIMITPTNTGLLMAKYCVAFDTMTLFTQVTGKEVLQQVLALISKCQEFSEIYLRVHDKKTLNLLNKCRNRETIRFPFNSTIKTVDMKINCIIQAVFGCLQILEQSLVTESQKIMRIGERISNCLAKYLETKGNCYSSLLSALILAKCFHARLWENSPFVSKQLAGIGNALSSALVAAGKTTFKALLDTNPREIERIINRKAPMGNTIQEQIEHLPDYELILEEVTSEEKFSVNLKIRLRNAPLLQMQSSVDVNSTMTLLVGDTTNNIFLCQQYRHSYLIQNPENIKTFDFPISYEQEIKAHLISENWVGIDCETTLIPSTAPKSANNHNKENASKNQTKKPSHIQTLVDTFFKKTKAVDHKSQKRKQENTVRSSTKQSDSSKENIAPTENQHPKQTERKHLQRQNSLILNSDQNSNCSKTDLESLPQTHAQVVLQKLIDDSIQECKKVGRNLPKNTPEVTDSENEKGYFLPQDFTQNSSFDEMSNSAVLVCSNGYSATVRRASESNTKVPGKNTQANNSNESSQYDRKKSGFKSNFQISHLVPDTKKKQFRFKENMNCTVNFESSLHERSSDEENNPNKSISLMFQYTPRKKCKHEATTKAKQHLELNKSGTLSQSEPYRTNPNNENNVTSQSRITEYLIRSPVNIKTEAPETPKSGKNLSKTITWRSPLVTSPAMKYSPVFCNEVRAPDGSMNLSCSSWNNTPPVQDNKTNPAFRASNNESAEMSGLSFTTPSESSSTCKPSQSSRPTLRENIRKNIVSSVPLSDRDYLQALSQGEGSKTDDSKNKYAEDEFVSTSLLESFGLIQRKPVQPLSQNLFSANSSQGKKIAKPGNFPTISEYYEQCESEFKNREVQHRKKQATINSSQIKNDSAKIFKRNLEVGDSSGQQNVNNSFSLSQRQPSSTQSARNVESQAFDLSFNDSLKDTSQLFNFEPKKCELNKSLTQPTISTTINLDQQHHQQFGFPTSSSMQTFKNLHNFRNEQNSFAEQELQNDTCVLELPPQGRKCFSQNVNPPRFNMFAPHGSFFNRFSEMSQPLSENFPRTDNMQNHFGSYRTPNFTMATQPIKRKLDQPCTTNCQCFQCVQHFRNKVQQKPPISDFSYYTRPDPSQHYACHDLAGPPCCASTSASHCCARMPFAEPNRFYKQPQFCQSSPQNFWDTASNTCNLEHPFYGNQKRQKLESNRHAPFAVRRYSFHDCEPLDHIHNPDSISTMKIRHCSFHEDDSTNIYSPPSERPYNDRHTHLMQFGRKHSSGYNQGDKQFLMRRYLNSVEQKQIEDHGDINSNAQSQCFLEHPLPLGVSIEDVEATLSDNEFAES